MTPLGEDCILNTAGGVSSKPHISVRFKSGDPFDKPNGSDGDEVVLVPRLGIVFFDNMGYQAEIVLNEGIPGLHVPGGIALQVLLLLFRL